MENLDAFFKRLKNTGLDEEQIFLNILNNISVNILIIFLSTKN